MKKKLTFILIFTSIIFSQNINYSIWNGNSVSTSDNLDAIGLNPAGLGVLRGNQYAFAIKQVPLEIEKYLFTYSRRNEWGLGFETSYDSYNESMNHSIGYGSKIFIDDLYFGVKYSKNNYSLGSLYRPHKGVSIGITTFKGENNIEICDDECNENNYSITYNYNNVRIGFSFRPFEFIKKGVESNKFLNYSNFTIGYDKTMNNLGFSLDSDQIIFNSQESHFLDKDSYQEQFFMTFTATPGIDISYFIHDNYSNEKTFGLNLSFKMGDHGAGTSYYPSNPFYSTSVGSNTLYYYNYSQKKEGLNFTSDTQNYIKMKLEGYFIEEEPTKSIFDNLPFISSKKGTQLKSWTDKIYDISNDPEIDGLIIELGNVEAGFSKRRTIFQTLMRMKENGKKIIVYTQNDISNMNYHLISMADEIYTHRMSSVLLRGLTMEPMFIRGLLDTISIVPEVIRVSPYKTAADMLLNRKMSDEMKENYSELLEDLYEIMVNDISTARGWDNEKTKLTIDNGPYLSSIKAIESELIDGVMFPDEFGKYINKINDKNIEFIDWDEYNNNDFYVNDWKTDKKSKIAVIYAVGGIVSGESNPGAGGSTMMGDKTIIKAIKDAREDKDIKAIILRVDSGGGSALASDMMWKEVYNTTVQDSLNIKPFIVSMSDVAASGGYYISCQADKILADESTITGSIGVIWARLNFSELMEKIGINTEKIMMGKNADFLSGSRLLTKSEQEKTLNSINDIYNIFKERVIDGRKNLNNIDELDEIALGRVWSGKRAKELGLVDETGNLYDAIEIAKIDALIPPNDDIEIVEYPQVKNFSLFDLFTNDNDDTRLQIIKLTDLFPEEFSNELETLEIIPIIMDNEIQFLMPYKININ